MIKLIVHNNITELYKKIYEDEEYEDEELSSEKEDVFKQYIQRIKPYDENKWKDGAVYYFDTLKEVLGFINSCEICFTDEYDEYLTSTFDPDHADEIEYLKISYAISEEEANLIILNIRIVEG